MCWRWSHQFCILYYLFYFMYLFQKAETRLLPPGCFILVIQCSDSLHWCPRCQRHIWFCSINTLSFFFFFFTSHINKILVVKYSRLLAQSESNWWRVRKDWGEHVRCSLTHLASCVFRCADAHVYLSQANWHQVCCPESPVSVTVWQRLSLTHSWEAPFVTYQ